MEHRIEGKHLSKEVRAKIIGLKNYTGFTFDEIAQQCECSVCIKI